VSRYFRDARSRTHSDPTPAGRWANQVLALYLELRSDVWYPEAEVGPTLKVYAFGGGGLSRFW